MKIWNFLSLLSILFTSIIIAETAQAKDWKIVSASFYSIDHKLALAEYCGKLQGPENVDYSKVRIEIKVDPNTNTPGYYMTPVNDLGKFCMLVRTLRGRANISVYYNAEKVDTLLPNTILN